MFNDFMPIKKGELDFLDGERKIKIGDVFLEKTDSPTSSTGFGIPSGILLLTNRRLFFFSKEKTESLGTMILRERQAVWSAVADELAGKISESATDCLVEKSGNEKFFERLLDNKDSFVIPVKRIVTCEKIGNWFDYWIGIFGSRKRYVRIGFLDYAQGEIIYYCIYCNKPTNPLYYTKAIKYQEWFEEINSIKNTNASLFALL
jgi:hypothetical protein